MMESERERDRIEWRLPDHNSIWWAGRDLLRKELRLDASLALQGELSTALVDVMSGAFSSLSMNIATIEMKAFRN